MSTYTYTGVIEDEKKKVIILYKDYQVKTKNQYVIFFAKTKGASITIYTTNKMVVSGNDCLSVITKLNSFMKQKFSLVDDQIVEEKKFFPAMGSDEVGTGSLFGPVVVCACYVDDAIKEKLEKFQLEDSKAMNDEKILEVVPQFIESLPYSVLVVRNEKFNDLTKKYFNMNKIKAYLHNAVYINLIKKIQMEPVGIVDQFCESSYYFKYLFDEKNIYKNLIFKTKGESYHLAVATASVIARYKFLLEMQEISDMVGFTVNNGSGPAADKDLQTIYDKYGIDFLPKITKMNFRNLEKIIKTKSKNS